MISTGGTPLAKSVIPGFICPSDPGSGMNPIMGSGSNIFAKSNYIGVYTAHYHATDPVVTNGGSDRNATFYDNSKVYFAISPTG